MALAELNDQSSDCPAATRDRIVEAARRLFFQQGYTATGMAQILKEAGARSGSLYHFFPSKEDLLRAVLERYREMLQTHVLQPAFDRVSDPVERLFAVLDGYRRLLEQTGFDLGCPIGNLALEVSNALPNVRALIVENFDARAHAVEGLIDDASDRLPADLDRAALARHVLATLGEASILAVIAAAALAGYGPAMLAARVDPNAVIRGIATANRSARV